jgi:hypothetical protein
MNAAERIEAAIAKLEGLTRWSTTGPWRATHHVDDAGDWTHADIVHDKVVNPEVTWRDQVLAIADLSEDDAELIVTLHRTIDAQLAILRGALYAVPSLAVALADAILGGDPDD